MINKLQDLSNYVKCINPGSIGILILNGVYEVRGEAYGSNPESKYIDIVVNGKVHQGVFSSRFIEVHTKDVLHDFI